MNHYKEIIRQCRQHDRRAQLEFYMLFYKSVFNSCLRILGNAEESEEVMQEVFLKVFDRPEYYEEEANGMERVLKCIGINRSIDIYRKRKIQFIELRETYDHTDDDNETDEEEQAAQLEDIYRTIKLLPEGYRMIFSLHLIEGLSYEEIAGKLQISASSVRSQFTRAKQKLITLIKENHCHENIIR